MSRPAKMIVINTAVFLAVALADGAFDTSGIQNVWLYYFAFISVLVMGNGALFAFNRSREG
jgi:hypothetical protein